MHPLMPAHALVGGLGLAALAACLWAEMPKLALAVTALCAYSWGALIVEGVSRLPAMLRRWHYRRWEGRYYVFEERQIRIELGADGEPWAVADDVLAAMALARAGLRLGGLSALEYRRREGVGDQFSLAGIRRLRAVARSPRGARFELWFERNVHLPALKRAARLRADPP